MKKQKTGVQLIVNERRRQIDEEHWSASHDANHYPSDALADAAACYALARKRKDGDPVRYWPWDLRYWKPTANDRVRELVKAGALIAAEIDRIQAK